MRGEIMKSKSILISVMVILFVAVFPTKVFAVPVWVNPDWDILDETYGNGPGQVSFNDSYDFHSGTFTEVPHYGYVTLTSGKGSVSARGLRLTHVLADWLRAAAMTSPERVITERQIREPSITFMFI